MTTIYSQADGDWSDTATWDTGTVPTASDTVSIRHAVTVSADFTAGTISIVGGSLTVKAIYAYGSLITGTVGDWNLTAVLNDTRTVRLDGVMLTGHDPKVSCIITENGHEVAREVKQNDDRDVIITDPGYIGTSATLQDIKPEGSGRAYARKIANGVRYLTVTIRIRASMPHYLGRLYRMAESPYQVLLVTDRSIIKGYIETIAPDQAAVGTEYISVKVTVAEGL